jgi:hypothetical protein
VIEYPLDADNGEQYGPFCNIVATAHKVESIKKIKRGILNTNISGGVQLRRNSGVMLSGPLGLAIVVDIIGGLRIHLAGSLTGPLRCRCHETNSFSTLSIALRLLVILHCRVPATVVLSRKSWRDVGVQMAQKWKGFSRSRFLAKMSDDLFN